MTPGYNPKGFEPEAHEPFLAPPSEVMDKYREVRGRGRIARNMTYAEIMEVESRLAWDITYMK